MGYNIELGSHEMTVSYNFGIIAERYKCEMSSFNGRKASEVKNICEVALNQMKDDGIPIVTTETIMKWSLKPGNRGTQQLYEYFGKGVIFTSILLDLIELCEKAPDECIIVS
jgi:hypothetical protein